MSCTQWEIKASFIVGGRNARISFEWREENSRAKQSRELRQPLYHPLLCIHNGALKTCKTSSSRRLLLLLLLVLWARERERANFFLIIIAKNRTIAASSSHNTLWHENYFKLQRAQLWTWTALLFQKHLLACSPSHFIFMIAIISVYFVQFCIHIKLSYVTLLLISALSLPHTLSLSLSLPFLLLLLLQSTTRDEVTTRVLAS